VLHDPTSRVAIWIVPAEEERQIALEAQALLAGESV
jgi:acetate kinase